MEKICPFTKENCKPNCALMIIRDNYDELICTCSITIIGKEIMDLRKQKEKI